jgi:hypothetical protein
VRISSDIPGLLMLVDLEKAFDTVEWPLIENKSPGIIWL